MLKPGTLVIDSMEPQQVEKFLAQSVATVRHPLNASGMADYAWVTPEARVIQVAREQIAAILGDMDGVEEELRKSVATLDDADCLYLIVEGFYKAVPWGCWTYAPTANPMIYRQSVAFGTQVQPKTGLYAKLMGWLWQLAEQGIVTITTADLEDTTRTLIAMYGNSIKPNHFTLRRYNKPKPTAWIPNNNVANLLALRMGGNKPIRLGRATAEVLVGKYGSLWSIANQPIEEVAKVTGRKVAENIFEAIGKEK